MSVAFIAALLPHTHTLYQIIKPVSHKRITPYTGFESNQYLLYCLLVDALNHSLVLN